MLHNKFSYRSDIDGLRALAVIGVIFFHFWPHSLRGGFIGVDIFFVISGFLITSIIYSKNLSGTFSFKNFYLRRIKRIMPAFFTMLAIVYIASYFFLLPNDFIQFAKNAVASSAYASNVYFLYQKIDYFSGNTTENPLLHTWSLAVEEQYYLLWPLILFLACKYFHRRTLYVFTCFLFLASFLFAIYCLSHNSQMGYYSVFSRAFELLSGAVLAIYLFHKNNQPNFHINEKHVRLISIIGFLLIIFSCLALSKKLPFPGYYALLPTVGAICILYAGNFPVTTFVSRFLASRWMVKIGLISYSLYLFHWPIITFWHYFTPDSDPLPWYKGLSMLIITLTLTLLTYRFIEQPLRQAKLSFPKGLLIYQIIPLGIVLALGYIVIQHNGMTYRFSEKIYNELDFPTEKQCFNYDPQILNQNNSCIFGKKEQTHPKIILFGDSHAAQFAPFFNYLAEKYHFNIKILAIGGCFPLLDTQNHLPSQEKTSVDSAACQQQIRYITEHYQDYDVFIIAARFKRYLSGKNKPISFDFLSEFKNTVLFLSQHQKKVIVLSEIPQDAKEKITYIIKRQAVFNEKTYNNLQQSIKMAVPNQTITVNDMPYSANNVLFINSATEFFYGMNSLPFYNGQLLYKDSRHLNTMGAIVLAKHYASNPHNLLKQTLMEWNIVENQDHDSD